jgi:hypothetical protein
MRSECDDGSRRSDGEQVRGSRVQTKKEGERERERANEGRTEERGRSVTVGREGRVRERERAAVVNTCFGVALAKDSLVLLIRDNDDADVQ